MSTQESSCSCDSTLSAVLRLRGTPAAAWRPASPMLHAVSGWMPTWSMSSMFGVRYLQQYHMQWSALTLGLKLASLRPAAQPYLHSYYIIMLPGVVTHSKDIS